MAIKVFWTDFAKNELKKIFDYYSVKASKTVAARLATKIVKETKRLESQPNIGQIEDNLKHRKQSFRYLVCDNYKIIYWLNENENRIEIIDVFDCRQNPIKLYRHK